jgi:hypothetical protein
MAEKVCNTHGSNQVISIELQILRVRTIIRALVDLRTRALSTIISPNSTAINRRRYAYACAAHAEAEGIPMVVDSNETEDEDFVTDIGTFDNTAPTVTPSVTQQTPTRTFRDPMPQFEARVSAILQDDIPSLAPFVAPSNTTSMDYMGDIYESISHHAYQNAPIGSNLDTEPIEQQDHAYTPDSPKYKDDYEDSKPKAIGTSHLKSAPRPPTNPEPFTYSP